MNREWKIGRKVNPLCSSEPSLSLDNQDTQCDDDIDNEVGSM